MKKLLITTLLTFALLGCTEFEEVKPIQESEIENEAPQTRSGTIFNDAVYHEETGSWLRRREDPYSLKKFQQARANLLSGNSTRSLTSSQIEAFSNLSLEATHYAVKIFPKTYKEQTELELMADIKVSYLPFDYYPLSETDVEASGLDESTARSRIQEEGRYTVTYEGYVSKDGPLEPETITLPVLYVVWPCGKPFPGDMDYEILYDVLIPVSKSFQTMSASSVSDPVQMLESEAIRIALGNTPATRASSDDELGWYYITVKPIFAVLRS